MGTAPIENQARFADDLRTALELTNTARVGTTINRAKSSFSHWAEFCAELHVPCTLHNLPSQEAKITYLLVYGLRYRRVGRTGKSTRAQTVLTAIAHARKGISDLGYGDPGVQVGSSKLHPLLSDFKRAMERQDDPSSRAYPVNLVIIRAMFAELNFDHFDQGRQQQSICDLTVVAFFWLLRPCEYLGTKREKGETRSTAFRLCDVHLHHRTGRVCNAADPNAPLNDANDVANFTFASLTFVDQKNAVRGEQVGHRATADPLICPVKAIARLCLHLREMMDLIDDYEDASETALYWHFNHYRDKWYKTKSECMTKAIRIGARATHHIHNIDPKLFTTKGLRPGGATALLCAGVDKDAIQLLGRWKSDAMLRYLRIQANSYTHHYSQKMFDAGDYTFSPQSDPSRDAPVEAPVDVHQLLTHKEMYEISDDESEGSPLGF